MLPTTFAPCFLFQFTQPKRAATLSRITLAECFLFQFTQPKRAATCHQHRAKHRDNGFQFTQPKRAATRFLGRAVYGILVSIHAAQAGCDLLACLKLRAYKLVSIHAAQAGCDTRLPKTSTRGFEFQFTQPKRAATVAAKIQQKRDSLKG